MLKKPYSLTVAIRKLRKFQCFIDDGLHMFAKIQFLGQKGKTINEKSKCKCFGPTSAEVPPLGSVSRHVDFKKIHFSFIKNFSS